MSPGPVSPLSICNIRSKNINHSVFIELMTMVCVQVWCWLWLGVLTGCRATTDWSEQGGLPLTVWGSTNIGRR